jgi:hypothetical protein
MQFLPGTVVIAVGMEATAAWISLRGGVTLDKGMALWRTGRMLGVHEREHGGKGAGRDEVADTAAAG